jgi:hypothetical protein
MSYTITEINSALSIGDSLSTINLNSYNLDQWVTSIQTSAVNYWLPLMNYYKEINSTFKTNAQIGSSRKPFWDSNNTTVSQNSANWLEPLSVIYPQILPPNSFSQNNTILISIYTEVLNWLNTAFPVNSAGEILYVQNQNAYVYFFSQEQGTITDYITYLADSTNCTTQDTQICATCNTSWTGTAICSNGDFTCDGTVESCNQCAPVPCNYTQTNNHYYTPTLAAFLYTNFNEVHESPVITCLNFQVQNCQWTFISQI